MDHVGAETIEEEQMLVGRFQRRRERRLLDEPILRFRKVRDGAVDLECVPLMSHVNFGLRIFAQRMGLKGRDDGGAQIRVILENRVLKFLGL
jgi:hypothetical protein